MNENTFNKVFNKYYHDLIIYANYYIHDTEECEDIVQDVFSKLWEDRDKIRSDDALKYYLIKCVKNRSLDLLRQQNQKALYEKNNIDIQIEENIEIESVVLYSELYNNYCKALEKVPKNIRLPYVMHREMGLKYKDIARILNISERTVEAKISKTLYCLRILLKDFLGLILYTLFL